MKSSTNGSTKHPRRSSRFTGFFCDGDDTVLKAALDRWPFCVGKVIRSPFNGIGLRCSDLDEVWDSEEGYDYWEDRIYSVEKYLPDFSTVFPALTFAFIKAECFGGNCDYAGFVVRNGETARALHVIGPGRRSTRVRDPVALRGQVRCYSGQGSGEPASGTEWF